MPWTRLDDGLIDHPKFNELMDEPEGWAVFGFWTAMLIWANKHTRKPGKTPGLLKRADVSRMDRANAGRYAGILVKVGMWESVDDGWLIHDFGEYLPSEKKLTAQRENARKGGLKKAENARKLASGQKDLATGQDELASGVPNSAQAGQDLAAQTLATHREGKGSSTSTGSPVAEVGGTGEGELPSRLPREACRLPENFKITEEMAEWGRTHVPHVNGRIETEKFRDHWRAASGQTARKKDWVAAWRTWMRNADERLGQRGNVRRQMPQGGLDDGFWER